ncbi:MAG: polysaccharide export protein [Acidobacteria bacterium]|nr:polysaccharide export protein [Acidobacteriota bacterium]
MRSVTMALATFLFILFVAPCAGQNNPGSAVTSRSTQPASARQLDSQRGGDRSALHKRNWRYRVRPGDVLELTFPFTPEFNQGVIVHPDGYITLRGLGEYRVEGRTVPEVSQALQTAFGKILHDPVITVDLKDFEKPYFIVGGEVGHTGKFEFRSDTTVSEAIAIAGGFKETSKHSQVLLFRRVSEDWAEVKVINLKKMLNTKNLSEDPHLQPGDMLYVPKNVISKIKPYIPIPGLGMYFNPAQF